MKNRENIKGFTLLELLTVISIIAVLMGIVVPIVSEATRKSKVAKSRATIAKIEMALSAYENDWGEFPPPPSNTAPDLNNNTGDLYTFLNARSTSGSAYMEIRTQDTNSNDQILDPWGNPYVVTVFFSGLSMPSNNNTTFDIYSLGPDGTTSTNGGDANDINNWSR